MPLRTGKKWGSRTLCTRREEVHRFQSLASSGSLRMVTVVEIGSASRARLQQAVRTRDCRGRTCWRQPALSSKIKKKGWGKGETMVLLTLITL